MKFGFWPHDKKEPVFAPSPIKEFTTIDSTKGNKYSVQSDNRYYVSLCYLGNVFDEKLKSDVLQYIDHYFKQGCFCVSFWYKGVDPTPYLQGLNYMLARYDNFAVFFNSALVNTAVDIGNKFSIYYPNTMNEAYIFFASDEEGTSTAYSVLGNKAKLSPGTDPNTPMIGQYIGAVVTAEGKWQFIFAYELNLK